MFHESAEADRLQELGEITSNPLPGVQVSLVKDGNIHEWNIIMDGPEGSPYAVSDIHQTSCRYRPHVC